VVVMGSRRAPTTVLITQRAFPALSMTRFLESS
jgi:hypothetical protein